MLLISVYFTCWILYLKAVSCIVLGKDWKLVWKEVLKLTPKGVSLRTSKFHTEKCLKYGIFHRDLSRSEAVAWELVWKEVLKLTPEGVSLRTSKFHTEKCLKYGIFHRDLSRSEAAAWRLE